MSEQKMKAMAYASYGGVDKLEQLALPRPKVGPGSVLIRVKAAGVNPVDWKVMGGYLDQIMDVTFPVIPGWDVAGVVEAVGFDTPEFKVGDEVYAYGRRDSVHFGSFAEYMVLPAATVARKPASLSWEEAAALPLAGGTAQRTLDALQLKAGQTLLIHNGSGGVGQAAIQLAVARGLRVLATGSQKNHKTLAALGAEPVTYGAGLVGRVVDLSPEGVDGVADFHGDALDSTLAVLKEAGAHASIADGSVTGHGGHFIWVRPDGKELGRLGALVDDGTLKVNVVSTYPMQEAAAAFGESMAGHAGGKIVLTEFTS